MSTMYCEDKYVNKLLVLKKAGKIDCLENIVNYDDTTADSSKGDHKEACKAGGIQYIGFEDALSRGRQSNTALDRLPNKDSVMFMCYTSGTTGNAKGVMLTHSNLLHDVESFMERVNVDRGTTMISYLPYPHVFEQALFGAILKCGGKIGYFTGHPKDLVNDC